MSGKAPGGLSFTPWPEKSIMTLEKTMDLA